MSTKQNGWEAVSLNFYQSIHIKSSDQFKKAVPN